MLPAPASDLPHTAVVVLPRRRGGGARGPPAPSKSAKRSGRLASPSRVAVAQRQPAVQSVATPQRWRNRPIRSHESPTPDRAAPHAVSQSSGTVILSGLSARRAKLRAAKAGPSSYRAQAANLPDSRHCGLPRHGSCPWQQRCGSARDTRSGSGGNPLVVRSWWRVPNQAHLRELNHWSTPRPILQTVIPNTVESSPSH